MNTKLMLGKFKVVTEYAEHKKQYKSESGEDKIGIRIAVYPDVYQHDTDEAFLYDQNVVVVYFWDNGEVEVKDYLGLFRDNRDGEALACARWLADVGKEAALAELQKPRPIYTWHDKYYGEVLVNNEYLAHIPKERVASLLAELWDFDKDEILKQALQKYDDGLLTYEQLIVAIEEVKQLASTNNL